MTQKDAIERLDLKQLLLEPEVLAQAEPDVHLIGYGRHRSSLRDVILWSKTYS